MSCAIILGGADCLWSDLAKVPGGVQEDDQVIAVNRSAVDYVGELDHLVSLHTEKLRVWIRKRERAGGNLDFVTWGRRRDESVDRIVHPWGGMCSGGYAVQIALEELHCNPVILCGTPLDPSPHYYDDGLWGSRDWEVCSEYHAGWEKNLPRMHGKVFSMSGWTRELLGFPPIEIDVEALLGADVGDLAVMLSRATESEHFDIINEAAHREGRSDAIAIYESWNPTE